MNTAASGLAAAEFMDSGFRRNDEKARGSEQDEQ